tara:strand:+ start:563 stop:856 length:294 start_codon:yes stop_codon:yes gene_type:complete
MATAKVKAPVGYHFMIEEGGIFYLMKTAPTGYQAHTDGEFTSQLTVDIQVKGTHVPVSTIQRTATATSANGSTTTTRTISPTRSTTSSGGGSSSGGY